jgi:lysozyme
MPCLPRIWHPETEALFAALQRSTLRRKVNREEHGAAPAEIRRWVGAGGRKLKGLARRREAEAALCKR